MIKVVWFGQNNNHGQFYLIEEEEEYFIDQLKTHKGHSNYND
jgi:hypothetical protein